LRHLNFGYTVDGGSTAVSTPVTTPQTTMIPNILGYGYFQAGATATTVTASVLPANVGLLALVVQLNQSFTGAGISAMSLNIGTNASPAQFITNFNPMQAVSPSANDSMTTLYFPNATTPIVCTMTATGANLSALTQGMITVFLQETLV
jgi:hypothetical protein